ncbi:sulfite exporter TauE/SafE family protein [Xanthobacter oligotrophicus]|uniref:Probable membrane transporter protein n=1 Tax=Xanthobacter oligotrophicus TaxID=2607286 RepID=A0ABW6ZYM4_9HYPH|nr:sulfite exporter TauE/SafE family protein [Xanthobacter oligotrophicus]MCG5234525.1 sulfite exporter TauE/SafE family protein [Xanthobacter oligotrophicus]
MTIYLPIAELPIAIFTVFAMGLAVGFISGMFGVGGGFLMTPLLIFTGVPPAVAVASVSPYMAASSFSGALSYWRKGMMDLTLAGVLLTGGLAGTAAGVLLFLWLRVIGQVDLAIRISYALLLGAIGSLMLVESLKALARMRAGLPPTVRRPGTRAWFMRLPLKMRFRRSRIYVSALPVIGIGFIIGLLGAVLGVGGGFILVPALIYLLRVPTQTSVGTSLVLTLVTMAAATVLHAEANGTVDAVLAFVLMIGGTMGAQFGARTGQTLKAEHLRLLLGILVLSVAVRVAIDLVSRPADTFAVTQEAQP